MAGPCTDWLTGDDVLDCCTVESTDGSLFDLAAEAAQEILFELSGRLYPGECEQTVRPCRTSCGCGFQVLSRGHIVNWRGDSWWCDESPCGCRALSRVKLPGYPVQEITEVKIDGVVVDPDTYRLDEKHWATRVRDPLEPDVVLRWPACQALDLPDTEEGTFSITYTFGEAPPEIGVQAAAQLACELYKACAGEDCVLPKGVTRVTRQGVTIEKPAFASWAGSQGWQTGMPLVDAFLSMSNPSGLKRRPTVWSPASTLRYARPEAQAPTS